MGAPSAYLKTLVRSKSNSTYLESKGEKEKTNFPKERRNQTREKIEGNSRESTVLMVCHRSSLLILDCMSSIMPSIGEASLLCEDSDGVLPPCLVHQNIIKY